MKIFLVWTLIEISISIISYFLSFFLLACKLYKSGLKGILHVSDMAIYLNIVFIGLYLVLAYNARLISTVCDFFNYFGMSINCRSCVCKLHKIFLTCVEAEAISTFEGFYSIVIYESSISTFFLISKLFKSNL